MRRSFAILIWILLGALAASLGIGSVLLHAKQERAELEQKLQTETALTASLRQEQKQTIEEANKAVLAAAQTASATRELLNTLTQEQTALEQASPLPTSAQTNRWYQTIAFPLGISIRTPPFTYTTSTDTLIESTIQTNDPEPTVWLSISRYDATNFEDLTRSLTEIESINYRLNQTLITGIRGRSPGGSIIFVLRTQRRGLSTHLIWARPTGRLTETQFLDSLSTLLFAAT